jgi:hypothetical protein
MRVASSDYPQSLLADENYRGATGGCEIKNLKVGGFVHFDSRACTASHPSLRKITAAVAGNP